MQSSIESGTHDLYWEPNNIASGTYFLKISGDKHFEYKKILFLKWEGLAPLIPMMRMAAGAPYAVGQAT